MNCFIFVVSQTIVKILYRHLNVRLDNALVENMNDALGIRNSGVTTIRLKLSSIGIKITDVAGLYGKS